MSDHEQIHDEGDAASAAHPMFATDGESTPGENAPGTRQEIDDDAAALDAYSRTVIAAVDLVGPAVVSVHVGQQRDDSSVAVGSGSGVIVTPASVA